MHTYVYPRFCFLSRHRRHLCTSDLKPWLVEVNASSSLTSSTVADLWMKEQVISDMLDILIT